VNFILLLLIYALRNEAIKISPPHGTAVYLPQLQHNQAAVIYLQLFQCEGMYRTNLQHIYSIVERLLMKHDSELVFYLCCLPKPEQT
jgi:hypothetical protein